MFSEAYVNHSFHRGYGAISRLVPYPLQGTIVRKEVWSSGSMVQGWYGLRGSGYPTPSTNI